MRRLTSTRGACLTNGIMASAQDDGPVHQRTGWHQGVVGDKDGVMLGGKGMG